MYQDILKMREERQKLEKSYEEAFTKRDREIADSMAWGLVGGLALLVDFTVLGGLGTAFAAMSGAVAIKRALEASQFKRKFKKLDQHIKKIEQYYLGQGFDIREEAISHHALKKELSKEFSATAKKEMDILKNQMDALKKELEEARSEKENDSKLQKPKYTTPKDIGQKNQNQKGLRRSKGGKGQPPSPSK